MPSARLCSHERDRAIRHRGPPLAKWRSSCRDPTQSSASERRSRRMTLLWRSVESSLPGEHFGIPRGSNKAVRGFTLIKSVFPFPPSLLETVDQKWWFGFGVCRQDRRRITGAYRPHKVKSKSILYALILVSSCRPHGRPLPPRFEPELYRAPLCLLRVLPLARRHTCVLMHARAARSELGD